MIDDDIDAEEEELEYEPRPALMGDGDVLVEDPIELLAELGGLALQVKDGALFVLLKDSMKWKNVEDAKKAATRPTVISAVPKTKQ